MGKTRDISRKAAAKSTRLRPGASERHDPAVIALVKLLARQAAEEEYERLLRTHASADASTQAPARSDRPPPEESAP